MFLALLLVIAPLVLLLSREVREDISTSAVFALSGIVCAGYILLWWSSGQASLATNLVIVAVGGVVHFVIATIVWIVTKLTPPRTTVNRHRD